MLQELADELGGVVGASRSAVDAGWMPHGPPGRPDRQDRRPKIYIACGISGAIQHLVGHAGLRHHHRHQPRQGRAHLPGGHYGIVGDLFRNPVAHRQLKALKAQSPGTESDYPRNPESGVRHPRSDGRHCRSVSYCKRSLMMPHPLFSLRFWRPRWPFSAGSVYRRFSLVALGQPEQSAGPAGPPPEGDAALRLRPAARRQKARSA